MALRVKLLGFQLLLLMSSASWATQTGLPAPSPCEVAAMPATIPDAQPYPKFFQNYRSLVDFMGPHDAFIGPMTADPNKYILLVFMDYMKTSFGAAPERLFTAREIRAEFDKFLKQAETEWLSLRSHLTEAHSAIVRARAADSRDVEKIRFNERDYLVTARLGGAEEGIAYLVRDGEREFVIKVFHIFPPNHERQNQAQALRELKDTGVSVVEVLGEDADRNALMLSYETGLAIDDIDQAIQSDMMPSKARKLFLLQYSRFINSNYRQFGPNIFNGMNPHTNNVLYNPYSNRWRIIDTR